MLVPGPRRCNTIEQIQVLSDHIEKLMMFLKHEATQKAKAHEQQRRLQKEVELVKVRSLSSCAHGRRLKQKTPPVNDLAVWLSNNYRRRVLKGFRHMFVVYLIKGSIIPQIRHAKYVLTNFIAQPRYEVLVCGMRDEEGDSPGAHGAKARLLRSIAS